ncbi:MAG TPA: DUF3592 domain-containing protein [Solirubrobacteraceae bacterium]|nr:DUF3592 domain-containing protein [Solirubrobacteraceae bacterium]
MLLAASSPAHQFFTIFGAVLAGIGLIFLLVGWILHRTSRHFRGPAERTEGRIVGFDTSTPGAMRIPRGRVRVSTWSNFVGSGPIYRPTVEFTTADGAQVTATSPFGTNPRPGHVGDTVTVLYDPGNPQRIRVETQSRWVGCMEVAFMLFGGGLAVLGILILLASR